MKQNLPHKPHGLTKRTHLPKADADRVKQVLRDLAFVLKMTQRVREEMDAEKSADELVLA